MIISASRRTDIPAFFSEWLIQRIREGYVCTRNPFRYHQVSRISLAPDVVDGIVFWSKNPQPLMKYFHELDAYMYYFQFTLNAYGKELESGLPPLERRVETFQSLAERLGKRRVIWRYDPILIQAEYPVSWHIRQFERLTGQLKGCTETCVISFLDSYPSIRSRLKRHGIREVEEEEKRILAQGFSAIAEENGMRIVTCCEEIDLSDYGIGHSSCIDQSLLSELWGCRIEGGKDKGQRAACGCMESIDIGSYRTCRHGCVYCYAGGQSVPKRRENGSDWQMHSPVLGSELTEEDRITEKQGKSLKDRQISLLSDKSGK